MMRYGELSAKTCRNISLKTQNICLNLKISISRLPTSGYESSDSLLVYTRTIQTRLKHDLLQDIMKQAILMFDKNLSRLQSSASELKIKLT